MQSPAAPPVSFFILKTDPALKDNVLKAVPGNSFFKTDPVLKDSFLKTVPGNNSQIQHLIFPGLYRISLRPSYSAIAVYSSKSAAPQSLRMVSQTGAHISFIFA